MMLFNKRELTTAVVLLIFSFGLILAYWKSGIDFALFLGGFIFGETLGIAMVTYKLRKGLKQW